MFGSFTEDALLAYAEQVAEAYKEKKIVAKQGTEYADNLGIGENDESFIDADESQDPSNYSETYDFTRCMRSNGTFYGTAGKCRKGIEVDPKEKKGGTSGKRATANKAKADKHDARLKAKILKEIEKDTVIAHAKKEKGFRKNALKNRQAFIKANRYPAANEGMQKEIERIRKEIAELDKRILREKRRIARQVIESERKVPRAERLARLAATRARAEKVLADIRKETPDPKLSDTQRSAMQGVFNKSKWD